VRITVTLKLLCTVLLLMGALALPEPSAFSGGACKSCETGARCLDQTTIVRCINGQPALIEACELNRRCLQVEKCTAACAP
jgi:hypothetical protein